MLVQNRRILIVEDEQDIANLVRLNLADLYSDVELAGSGTEALALLATQVWDLVILDIRLPGIDGLEVCRRIRADMQYVPILMLTAKSSELDRVLGLEIGADDYMAKPFSIMELIARVKAIFRRLEAVHLQEKPVSRVLQYADLMIDSSKRKVNLDGRQVELTAKEFDLLLHFAQHPGLVYTRAKLLDEVWGYGHDGYEHTVNSHINRLRSKIEKDPSDPQFIHTVWGVGYRFGQ